MPRGKRSSQIIDRTVPSMEQAPPEDASDPERLAEWTTGQSLQPGSARGNSSQENSLQPGSARGATKDAARERAAGSGVGAIRGRRLAKEPLCSEWLGCRWLARVTGLRVGGRAVGQPQPLGEDTMSRRTRLFVALTRYVCAHGTRGAVESVLKIRRLQLSERARDERRRHLGRGWSDLDWWGHVDTVYLEKTSPEGARRPPRSSTISTIPCRTQLFRG